MSAVVAMPIAIAPARSAARSRGRRAPGARRRRAERRRTAFTSAVSARQVRVPSRHEDAPVGAQIAHQHTTAHDAGQRAVAALLRQPFRPTDGGRAVGAMGAEASVRVAPPETVRRRPGPPGERPRDTGRGARNAGPRPRGRRGSSCRFARFWPTRNRPAQKVPCWLRPPGRAALRRRTPWPASMLEPTGSDAPLPSRSTKADVPASRTRTLPDTTSTVTDRPRTGGAMGVTGSTGGGGTNGFAAGGSAGATSVVKVWSAPAVVPEAFVATTRKW